jgi:hypothetical protein
LASTTRSAADCSSETTNFALASLMSGGTPSTTTQVQGYECVSTGDNGMLNQAMPPSWTDNTDPNVAFDTKGRAYQVARAPESAACSNQIWISVMTSCSSMPEQIAGR